MTLQQTLRLNRAARMVGGALGAGAVAAATVLAAAPAAFAEPLPPNCTAADLAQVTTGVSAATTVYLFTHPDVNAFSPTWRGPRVTPSALASPTT